MGILGFPDPNGKAAFDAAVSLSEGTRQADMAAALAACGGNPAKYAAYEAAVRAANEAHRQRIAASAAEHGFIVT
jgi:hypothetical protein